MVLAIPSEVPMRILALAILAIAMVSAAGQARAQTYDPAFPVCMHVVAARGGTSEDCTYYTLAQCAASGAGRGALCNINPYSRAQRRRRNKTAGGIAAFIEVRRPRPSTLVSVVQQAD